VVSEREMRSTAERLRAAGARVNVEVFGRGHHMPKEAEEMRALMTFWSESLKSPPPPGSSGDDVVEVDPHQSVMERMSKRG
jgi:hypothetical protein